MHAQSASYSRSLYGVTNKAIEAGHLLCMWKAENGSQHWTISKPGGLSASQMMTNISSASEVDHERSGGQQTILVEDWLWSEGAVSITSIMTISSSHLELSWVSDHRAPGRDPIRLAHLKLQGTVDTSAASILGRHTTQRSFACGRFLRDNFSSVGCKSSSRSLPGTSGIQLSRLLQKNSPLGGRSVGLSNVP